MTCSGVRQKHCSLNDGSGNHLSFRLMEHVGPVLPLDQVGQAHATYACAFFDEDTDETFLFYTEATPDWSESHIEVAVSNDGIKFKPLSREEPLVKYGRMTLTPAVFKVDDTFYMAFAFEGSDRERRIALARANDILGPYKILGELARPTALWEGHAVDLGPSVARISDRELLLFYSNTRTMWGFVHRTLERHTLLKRGRMNVILSRRRAGLLLDRGQFGALLGLRRMSFFLGFKLINISLKNRHVRVTPGRRRIGILRIKVTKAGRCLVSRYERNPLGHLNGEWGSWCESLFCPGYMKIGHMHVLLPTAARHSTGLPYDHFIGVYLDETPYFERPVMRSILINGPEEKAKISSHAEGTLLLDTPSPIVKDDMLWLYYALADTSDLIWTTALSIFEIQR